MEYGLSEKESKASDSFLLAAFLNLAMCYLKLREYTKAVECCDKPVSVDNLLVTGKMKCHSVSGMAKGILRHDRMDFLQLVRQ
ncbi:hypothetical protein AAES_57306 [Amazona aestiva]|uniref:Uncharacterized protein n=1 Tax=Amazona aestiva TaxID=12930 RepID=A0A0Q3RDR4_AMAAE|nr:hypothetical protein AAES_57306 [Amazona aestiva]